MAIVYPNHGLLTVSFLLGRVWCSPGSCFTVGNASGVFAQIGFIGLAVTGKTGGFLGIFSQLPAAKQESGAWYTFSMFTHADIDTLQEDFRTKSPVLSLYLPLEQGGRSGRLGHLRRLISSASQQIDRQYPTIKQTLQKYFGDHVIPQITDIVSEHNGSDLNVSSIVIFMPLSPSSTSTDHNITVYPLPVSLPPHVAVGKYPYIRPLLFTLDQYEPYMVIRIYEEHAYLYHVNLGQITHLGTYSAYIPRAHQKGGWSQERFHRHRMRHINAAIRDVARATEYELKRTGSKRIILAGNKYLAHAIKKILPPRVQKHIIGICALPEYIHEQEVLSRVKSIADSAEQAEEQERVQSALSALAHPGQAAHGLVEVLDLINKKKAAMIVVKQGYTVHGNTCDNCGSFSLLRRRCLYCNSSTRIVDDVVGRALAQADHDGSTIEFVSSGKELGALGNIVATTRY